MPSYVVHIDGGARGNPGPAGWGAVVSTDTGEPVTELRGALPYATNNVAEYNGLIAALDWCVAHAATDVHVRRIAAARAADAGVYKVKNEASSPCLGRRGCWPTESDACTTSTPA
jgi:hypothetical protein